MKLWMYGALFAGILAFLTGFAAYFDRQGAARIQARWDRAVAADLQTAHKAKDDAEIAIPDLTEAERDFDRALPTHSPRCPVPDPWDRDCR